MVDMKFGSKDTQMCLAQEFSIDMMAYHLQLVLSWHMKAATMCEFSKQEFISGLQALGYVLTD